MSAVGVDLADPAPLRGMGVAPRRVDEGLCATWTGNHAGAAISGFIRTALAKTAGEQVLGPKHARGRA